MKPSKQWQWIKAFARDRRVRAALAVTLAHGLIIWGVQQGGGSPGQQDETDDMGLVMSEIIVPTERVAEQPQSAPKPAQPQKQPPQPKVEEVPPPQDAPSELAAQTPVPPVQSAQAAPPIDAPVATETAAPAPQRTTQPSVDASYLNNPRPEYPAISRRLNEQGTVIVRVLIGPRGEVLQAEVGKSSGFERLDRVALGAVRRWRYKPGMQDGHATTLWFNVPVNFVLEQ